MVRMGVQPPCMGSVVANGAADVVCRDFKPRGKTSRLFPPWDIDVVSHSFSLHTVANLFSVSSKFTLSGHN